MLTTESITSFSGEHRFLSNFWPCTILFYGVNLPSVEHAYVAAKCGIYRKDELLELVGMTASQVKRYGRTRTILEDWDGLKYGYMLSFVTSKFTDHENLAKMLIATGDALLIEGNTWGDTYWGVCKGEGQNNLGKILMKVRDQIRSDYK